MGFHQRLFFKGYNIASQTMTYGKLGGPSGFPVQLGYGVQTSGSSTTVTGVSSSTPFDPCNVGDLIVFQKGETTLERTITAKASGNSITVSSAVDLTGGYAGSYFYPRVASTTASDAKVGIDHYAGGTIIVDLPVVDATNTVTIEILGWPYGPLANSFTLIAQKSYDGATATAWNDYFAIPDNVYAVSLGVKTTNDPTGQTNTINAALEGRR